VTFHGKIRLSHYLSGLKTISMYLECTAKSSRSDSTDSYTFTYFNHEYLTFKQTEPAPSVDGWESLYDLKDRIYTRPGQPIVCEYVISNDWDLCFALNDQYPGGPKAAGMTYNKAKFRKLDDLAATTLMSRDELLDLECLEPGCGALAGYAHLHQYFLGNPLTSRRISHHMKYQAMALHSDPDTGRRSVRPEAPDWF
jgi:hypothetical protein